MSWDTALKAFTSGLAFIATYFIWELIREYKLFKKETGGILADIKEERRQFEHSVKSISLETQNSFKSANLEILKLKNSVEMVTEKTSKAHDFMKKGLELARALNSKSKRHEDEINHLRLNVGKLTTIYKTEIKK